jgi:hypothetical protein
VSASEHAGCLGSGASLAGSAMVTVSASGTPRLRATGAGGLTGTGGRTAAGAAGITGVSTLAISLDVDSPLMEDRADEKVDEADAETDEAKDATVFSTFGQSIESCAGPEYRYVIAPAAIRRTNSHSPVCAPGRRRRDVPARSTVLVGTGGVERISCESAKEDSVVLAPKRTPENLPLQPEQYLARSLFAV